MKIHPYLDFAGRCDEALAYYEKNLGAKIGLVHRFGGSPMADQCGPEWQDKVMHASFTIDENVIYASDGHGKQAASFAGISMSINVNSVEEGNRLFNALAENGTVQMPFAPTFWAKGFGMVADPFGLVWMLNVE